MNSKSGGDKKVWVRGNGEDSLLFSVDQSMFFPDTKGNPVTELTLISPRQRQLKPLVEAALRNEGRLLEAGIRRAEQRLHEFETLHRLSTAEFVRRFEKGELDETLELAEWIGEYRLLERLREKADTLREIQFAD